MGPASVLVVTALGTVLLSVGAGRAPSDEASATPTGTVAPVSIDPLSSAAPTTTTQAVTVALTSMEPTSSSHPAVADPGDLYTLDLASGEISRLTTDPRLDGAPAWFPDGARMLFGRLVSGTDLTNGNADIFVIAADGTAEQRLTDHPADDLNPRSSPDGTSVVFTSDRDGNPEIYLLELATREVRRLTNNPASDRYPAFAPDGRTIVFTSDRAGNEDLYLMDVAGADIRSLTDTPGTEWLGEFSPDGATIAFATDHSIDLIDSDGNNRTTLTANAANHPSWSPDGRRIAAVTRTERGDFAICTIDVATGAITVLTDDEADDFYPAWSPNGDSIVFTRAPRDG